MPNLLVLYSEKSSTNDIFINDFPPLFRYLGLDVDYCDVLNVTKERIMKADSIILIRQMNPQVLDLIKAAQRAGVFVIAFYDDDLLNLPKCFPHIPWQLSGMRHILKSVDAVLTFCPGIRDKYYELSSGRCYQMNMPALYESNRRYSKCTKNDGISVVYAASPTHKDDAEKLIIPIIKSLNSFDSKVISFEFVGVKPEINFDTNICIKYTDSMPLDRYRQYMMEREFDIGLAPLEADSFTECKYFNKFIEYTIVGTVGVYSNCKPYTYAVNNGFNGFLANNDVKSWVDVISEIINNPNCINSCRENAIKQIKANHSIEAIAYKLKNDIPELTRSKKNSVNINLYTYNMKNRWYRLITTFYMFFFFLKNEGFKWTYKKTIAKINRLFSRRRI